MIRKGDEPVPGYRLDGFLGRGAFGEVWQSTAPGGTHVALKFINLSGKNGLKEYRAIQRVKEIRHAHLLPIHAFWLLDQNGDMIDDSRIEEFKGRDSDAKFDGREPSILVVAIMLADMSLADRLEEHQQTNPEQGMPIDELLDHIEDAAKGIDFLSSSRHDLGNGPVGLQHCDIKPQNILMVGNSAMVCDFGLARVLSDAHARTTGMAGSPAYMAPECIQARQPSSTTDQYSLAITYVELRTGKLPFDSESYAAVLDAHLHGKVDLKRLSTAEQAVIQRAIATDPEDRYPTSREMVRALRRAVESCANDTPVSVPIAPPRSAVEVALSPLADVPEDPPSWDLSGDSDRSSALPMHLAGTMMPDDSNMPTSRAASTCETSATDQSLVDSHDDDDPADRPGVRRKESDRQASARRQPFRPANETPRRSLAAPLAIVTVIALVGVLGWLSPSIIARFKSERTASAPAVSKPPLSVELPKSDGSSKIEKQEVAKPVVQPETIELRIVPADADVLVDGQLQATDGGTWTITGRLDQVVQIRASKLGFEPYTQQQSLAEWASATDPITLRRTTEGFIALAHQHADALRHREAVVAFDNAIERGADSPEIYLARGKSNVESDNLSAALEDFERALVLKSNFADAFESRADLLIRNRNTIGKAVDDYRNARKYSTEYQHRISDKLARALRIQGEHHQENRRYSQSLSAFEEAIRIDPQLENQLKQPLATAHSEIAQSLLDKHDYDAAIDHFMKSIQRLPKESAKVNLRLTEAYLGRGTQRADAKQYNTAIGDFDAAIRLDAKSDRAWIARGRANLMLGKYTDADNDFQAAIDVDPAHRSRLTPELADVLRLKGMTDIRAADYKSAIDALNKSIRLDPAGDAYGARGYAHNAIGKHNEAIVDLTNAIRREPKQPIYYTNRAFAKNSNGQFREALVDLKKSIQLNSHNPIALNNQGYAHRMLGRFDKAIEDYQGSLKLASRNNDTAKQGLSMAYWTRGNDRLKKHHQNEAIEDFQLAVKHWPKFAANINPRLALAYVERGRSAGRAGNYRMAITDFDSAIKMVPTDAEAYRLRGMAHAGNADSDSAIADYTMAIRHRPNDSRLHLERAKMYLRKRDYDLAVFDASTAIRLDRRFVAAYRLRATAYSSRGKTGDFAHARADRTKANQLEADTAPPPPAPIP